MGSPWKRVLFLLILSLLFGIPGSRSIIFPHQSDDLCTSAVLTNGPSCLYATNLDNIKDRSDGLIFVNRRNVKKSFNERDSLSSHISWTSKYGSVTCNLIASQTPWAGMNESGLVISLMRLEGSTSPAPDRRPWIWVHFWMQYVLDMCNSIEQVFAIDSTIRTVSNSRIPHYMVTDRTGRTAVVEFTKGRTVTYSGSQLPLKVLANSPYKTSLKEWNVYCNLKKEGKPVPPMGASSRGRFIRAAESAVAFSPCNPDSAVSKAFRLLYVAAGQHEKGPAPCWSLVFDTGRRRLYLRTQLNPEIRFIDFNRLDFSCQAPVKMLDINAKLNGDITGQLHIYSYQEHYAHALANGRKWGLNMTPDELAEALKFYDSFPCGN